MGMKLNNNAINQAEKGTVIYSLNDQVDSICIILKGRVLVINDGVKVLMGSGSFFGISDLFAGRFLNSYIAYDDLTFYCFPVSNKDSLANIFAVNKDYRGLAVASLIRFMNDAEKIYNSLLLNINQLYDFIKANYDTYLNMGKRLGFQTDAISLIEEMEPYNNKFTFDDKKLLYYKDFIKIPLDIMKSFCAAGDIIAPYLVEELSDFITQLIVECMGMAQYISRYFDALMSVNDACLYKGFAVLAINLRNTRSNNDDLVQIIDSIVDRINSIENLFHDKVGCNLTVDRKRMEEVYYALLSGDSDTEEQVNDNFQYSKDQIQQVDKDLNNSLKQIIAYAVEENEKAELLEQLITDFIHVNDKLTMDDEVRILRKKIAGLFYELYEKVFFRAFADNEIPKAVQLFLNYGFLDERLLTKEQLKELYFLEGTMKEVTGPCPVYNIYEWLSQIYRGNKEPSKNDFDMDYKDSLRDRRKRGEITEEEERRLQVDLREKVIYEVHNMFRYNHRLVNGQITTFVPMLYSEAMIRTIQNLFVTENRVNEAVKELLNIDYSIFHREILYVDNEKGIMKEYIMKQVFPDIILLPTAGHNGVMWQEITGKRKSSEGRFCLPIFTEQSIKDILIKLFGRFRWELCRSIQGSSWNNIKYKSLTSEYSDYIQFYRKNHDLSEDAREKIKSQIQKGKNNYREIFVIDYEAWIKGESTGSLRMNKVSREILATYCPFSKSIRDRLSGQPIFADAMARFTRNSLKKVKELDLRFRALQKEEIELTEELMETYIFYRDL